MFETRFRSVYLLLIITTFAIPICTMRWTHMWLEFHDWWLLFVWGHYVVFGEIGILGSINEPGFISVNVIILGVLWVVLGIVLIISFYNDTRNSFPSPKGFFVTLAILILQIILPVFILRLAISPGVLISNISPFPTPSILMIGVYIIFYTRQGRTREGIETENITNADVLST